MTFGFRLVAVFVAAVLVLTGPWLPGSLAQQPPQSAPSAPPAQPSDQPVPPVPPAPAYPLAPSYEPVTMEPGLYDTSRMPYGFYQTAAGVSTAVLIPGRTATCLIGSGLFLGTLLLTLGTGYRFATSILEEGCGGKWIVRAEDFVPDRPVTPSPNPPPR